MSLNLFLISVNETATQNVLQHHFLKLEGGGDAVDPFAQDKIKRAGPALPHSLGIYVEIHVKVNPWRLSMA